ncbi:hypothetical protein [Virgibacillus sp. DJP39]|uniref:hypothetical protein n=1 Tax=Virgibacillus sp. DJP39 TaxID=3409790 RepID=UPI003BB51B16
MDKKGWFLLFAGGLVIFAILMLGHGQSLYNGQVSGEIGLSFFGVNYAEGVTTNSISQYGSTFLILSTIPILAAIFCYRKFLKLVPVVN